MRRVERADYSIFGPRNIEHKEISNALHLFYGRLHQVVEDQTLTAFRAEPNFFQHSSGFKFNANSISEHIVFN